MNNPKNDTDPRVLINFLHVDCARNFAIHHSLIDYHINVKNLKNNFWRVTSNSTRDYGIIQWCKIFGSRSEETHWSKYDYIKDFDEQILKPLSISHSDWELLHSKMKDYRDKNAAHLDTNDWYRLIPEISTARDILFKSYEVFIGESGSVFLNLKDEYNAVLKDTNLSIAVGHNSPLNI